MSTRKTTNNLRITNFVLFTIILILLVKIVDLNDKNYKLKKQTKIEGMTHAEIVDQYFDLKKDYEMMFDEVLRLEEENQILGSVAAEKEYNSETK
jgi:hypothetical protein